MDLLNFMHAIGAAVTHAVGIACYFQDAAVKVEKVRTMKDYSSSPIILTD